MKAKVISIAVKVKNFVSRYAVVIFVVSSVLIFSFLTLKIAGYSKIDPTDDQISERKAQLKTVKLDNNAVEKIQELDARNINIETLFNNGRANPFE